MASQPLQSTSANQPQPLEGKMKALTIDDLAELENTLHRIAHISVAFGLQLGVENHRMQAIEAQYTSPYDRLREALRCRLRQLPLLTWHDVIQALRSNIVQEYQLASELESRYVYRSPLAASPQASATHVLTHASLQPMLGNHSAGMLPQSPTPLPPLSHHSYSQPSPHPPHPGPSLQPLAHHQCQQNLLPHPSFPLLYPLGESPSLLSSSIQSAPGAPQRQQTPSLHHTASTTPTGRNVEHLTAQPSHGQYRRPPAHLSPHHQHTNQWHHNNLAALNTTFHNMSHCPAPSPPHQPHLPHQPHPLYRAPPPNQFHSFYQPHPPRPPSVHYRFPTPNIPSPYAQSHTHQHIHHTEDGSHSDPGPPQPKRMCHNPLVVQYISYIKSVYRSSEVERNPNATKWPPTPSKIFINLACIDRNTVVTRQETDEITRCMVFDGSVDVILRKKRCIDFSDITKDLPGTALEKVILVEGAPGVGKSTFSWEFCRRWERGEIAQQYQLVLLLRLRDETVNKSQRLADFILNSSDHIRQAVVDELESTLGVNTLIILEGFDELPSTCRTRSSVFLQLIHGQLLPLATVLVTSRPWATQDIHRECSHRIFQRIEILGFTGKQIEEYVASVFTGEGKPANDMAREITKEVMSYINTYPQIKACMYIPLNSAIVVSVYQESKAGKCILPKTLTQLYYALTQTLLLRYLYGHPEYGQRRWKIQSLKEDLPQDVYSQLLAVSELAYSGICNDQGDSVQLIFSNLPPDFETLGLMQSVPQLYVTQGEDMSHNFLHLTVQEFLAALHISNMSTEKQLEHFQKQKEGRLRVVLRFLSGLTKLAHLSPEILRGLLLKKPNKDEKEGVLANPTLSLQKNSNESQIPRWNRYNITADVELSISHVHWMFEAQKEDIVPLVLQKKCVEFTSNEWLTPLDYYSLGYCIVHSHSHWVLTVEVRREVIGEEEVRMLVAGVSTRPDTTAKVVGLRGNRGGIGLHESSMNHYKSRGYSPLSISAEALSVLFVKLKNMIHLKELHLLLPLECCSISRPNLSRLRVLHLAIIGKKNWKLDTFLPRLSLQSLTIAVAGGGGGLGLDNAAFIGELLLSSNCPKVMYITDEQSPITAEVAAGQHVYKKQVDNTTSLVEGKVSVEGIRCRLDWYSLGCVIAHSNCQWVLTVEESRGLYIIENGCKTKVLWEEEVRMLVDGASTRPDTAAKVVGFRGPHMGLCMYMRWPIGTESYEGSDYRPPFISAEVLNVLFVRLKNIIRLQELHLNLPAQCSSIAWPNLSDLRVLHLDIFGEEDWKLDNLLPHLSLESLTITSDGFVLGLDNASSIEELFLSSNCPKHVHITDQHSLITAEVAVGQHVHEKELDNTTSLVERNKSVECIKCRLDWYSLGYVIAHSNFQWVLIVEQSIWKEVVGEKEVTMLVAGANTRCDTNARVVGLRGPCIERNAFRPLMGLFEKSGFFPLYSSAEALNMLFMELRSTVHLQELYLNLPAQCSSITWPNLSGIRVLHLVLMDERNWGLDTLLPHLPLESLTIQSTRSGGTVALEDYVAIGMLLSSSSCLKYFEFLYVSIAAQGMQLITKAMSDNHSLQLTTLVVRGCTFSDTAVQPFALFITNSTTLYNLSIIECTFSAYGLLELAQAIHHSSSLQKRELEYLTCTVDGDDEAVVFAQLSVDCPHLMDWLYNSVLCSHISDNGAKSIATALGHNSNLREIYLSNNSISDAASCALAQALHHNSTLERLDLSNNSISDTGSAALAQALHHNSTLEWLDLSNNSISDTGSAALAQALHHNSALGRLDLSNNSISDTGSAALAQALHHNSTLQSLDLSKNSIRDSGLAAIAQALHHNSTLVELNLSNISSSDTGSAILAEALHHNSTLKGLYLFNNSISDTGTAALAQAFNIP